MTLHAGLSLCKVSASYLLRFLSETEYDDNNNNNNKMAKMNFCGYLCKFNHTSGKHAYRQWLLGGGGYLVVVGSD